MKVGLIMRNTSKVMGILWEYHGHMRHMTNNLKLLHKCYPAIVTIPWYSSFNDIQTNYYNAITVNKTHILSHGSAQLPQIFQRREPRTARLLETRGCDPGWRQHFVPKWGPKISQFLGLSDFLGAFREIMDQSLAGVKLCVELGLWYIYI